MPGVFNTSKNLGQVKFVHVGAAAPANTNMMWLNTSVSPRQWRWYNDVAQTWDLFGANTGGGGGDVIMRLDSTFPALQDFYNNPALLGKSMLMCFLEKQFVHMGEDIEDFSSYDQDNGKIQFNQEYPAGYRVTVYFKF